MQRPADMSCTTVRDRLDPLLDGDLDGAEEARLQAHLGDCPACREELRLARALRQALREGLPTLRCPPEVTARVLAVARDESAHREATQQKATPMPLGERLRHWLAGGDGPGHLRPAATLAAAAALVFLLVAVPLVLRDALAPDPGQSDPQTARVLPSPEDQPEYSAEEIAQAEEQARLVLAAIAQVGRGAGRTVRDEVFEEALAQPARQVMESLRGGATLPSDRSPAADRSGRRQ